MLINMYNFIYYASSLFWTNIVRVKSVYCDEKGLLLVGIPVSLAHAAFVIGGLSFGVT